MVEDPHDPIEWGIDPATAKDLGRFDPNVGLPRVSSGRFGELWPPRAVSERVRGVERIARNADPGRWYWHTRPPHPAFRRIEPVTSPRLNAWTAEDDAIFAEKWTEDLDHIVDEYIAVYQSAWPEAIAVTKPESNAVSRFVHEV
jgi:hypothetical protein